MNFSKHHLTGITILTLCCTLSLYGQGLSAEEIKRQGMFENWVVREIKESGLIGGQTKYIYNLNSTDTIRGNIPYQAPEGTLLITSNIMANIMGIVKSSNQVFPERRGDGYCARLEVLEEQVKVIGMINIRAVAQGSIISGELYEPIQDTKSPYSKLNCGVPFTDRPLGVKYDYKADVGHEKVRSTSHSSRKAPGEPDCADIFVFLQKRWEDEDGNILAKRVGTAYKRISEDVPEWINGEFLPIKYGDITADPEYRDYMGLRGKGAEIENYTLNSKGKSVTINEVGWADEDEVPTHIILWFSSSEGKAFYGGVGNKLWIDNVEIVYCNENQ